MGKIQVLVVDDDLQHLELAQIYISRIGLGYEVHAATSVGQAIGMVDASYRDIVIVDGDILGRSGEEVLSHLCSNFPTTRRIMCSGSEDYEAIALRHGATWILKSPTARTYHNLADAVRNAPIVRHPESELALV